MKQSNIDKYRRIYEISDGQFCMFNRQKLLECIDQVLVVVNSGKLANDLILNGLTVK